MKTLLTTADIEYLLTQQEKLDKDIREKESINEVGWRYGLDKQHEIALRVEVHEFINECHDVWKYWKSKPIDKNRIIDEAVDVIHFVMLLKNKLWGRSYSQTPLIEEEFKEVAESPRFKTLEKPLNLIFELLESEYNSYVTQLYLVLKILDHYGFTSKDIIDAYNRKNKINFERMARNY